MDSSFQILWVNIKGHNFWIICCCYSVTVLCLTLCDPIVQHTRLPNSSLSARDCSDSYPLSQWCHPAISSSFIPFSCLQSFPVSGSFLVSRNFASGGHSIVASASGSVPSVNIQDWFPLGLTDLISLLSKGLSRVFSNTTVQKHQFFGTQLSLHSNSHTHTWLLGKTIALTRRTFVSKVTSLIFNTLSRLAIAFLPRSKCLLISWLQSPSTVIFEPPKIKSLIVSPSICHELMGLYAMI